MLLKQRYTFAKIDQDTAPDKRDTRTHWNIINMEVFLTSRGASLQAAKGPLPFPTSENDKLAGLYVIGDGYINDKLFIFTTDNNTNSAVPDSIDAIFEVNTDVDNLTLTKIQESSWGFSTYYPIQCVGIKEHAGSEKLYWVDALNQSRFINVLDPSETVDYVRTNPNKGMIVALSHGVVASKKAVVRYAYTQYNLGGSESKLSQFTDPINISTTGDSARITIGALSDEYTHFKVYRVMWESYNSVPTYAVIREGINGDIDFIDTGSLFLTSVSIDEIVDLGSDLLVPTTIAAKKQRMFYANYKLEPFTLPVEYDMRAYSFGTIGTLRLKSEEGDDRSYTGYDDPELLNVENSISLDAINYDNLTYVWQSGGSSGGVLGAEGVYTAIKLERVTGSASTALRSRVHKQGEVYRVGIVCQDEFGRSTAAMWVCDLRIPYTENINAENTDYKPYYKVSGTLKSLPPGVVSYKFVYVVRDRENKSVLAQGVSQPIMNYKKGGVTVGIYPFPNIKEVKAQTLPTWFDVRQAYEVESDFPGEQYGDPDFSDLELYDPKVNLLITPDTLIYKSDIPGTGVRAIGVAEINSSYDYTRFDFRTESGDAQTFTGIRFNFRELTSLTGSALKHMPHCLFGGYSADDFNQVASMYYFYTRRADRFYLNSNFDQVHELEFCRYLGEDNTVTVDSTIISNAIDEVSYAGYKSYPGNYDNTEPCNYTGEFCDGYIFKATDLDWAGSSDNYSSFTTAGNFTGTDRGFPIVDIIQVLNAQYGGGSFEARSYNIYIDASAGSNQVGTYTQLFGDVYSGIYYFAKCTSARNTSHIKQTSVFDYIAVPLESEVSVELANKLLRSISPNFTEAVASNLKALEVKNLMTYNKVFSQIPNAIVTPARQFNTVVITEYLTRITTSSIKFAGEVIDNWTKINTGTYMDAESTYGEIIALVRSVDNIYIFQPKGIAFASIAPDKQVSTETGNIQLGKGDVLDDVKYLSTDSGCGNRQAIAVKGSQIFFIDNVNKTFNSLKEGELSRLKGFNSVADRLVKKVYALTVNNPDGGFVVINNHLKQVLFQFSAEFPMLVYNFATGAFTNTRTYSAYYHIAFNDLVLGVKDSKLYVNDEGTIGDYYGEQVDAELIMYVEPIPGTDKVFDALEVMKEGALNFDTITVDSPTRTSGEQPLLFRSKYDKHTAHLPRVEGARDRFRERNVFMKLGYSGSESLEVDEVFVKFTVKK